MSITPEIENEDGIDTCPHCFGEIDTWPVERRAVKAERERIIALLEDNQWRDEVVFNFVITLIKGDNK